MTDDLPTALAAIDGWGADHAAAALVGPDGIVASHNDLDHEFRWASVTKLATALAILSAIDDGTIDLDEPAGPPGSTVRHLLAHASGLPFEGEATMAAPGRLRIYSNPGFDALGELLAARAGTSFAAALAARVLEPLGMGGARLVTRPSEGLHGTLADAASLARGLLRPIVVRAETLELARTVAFPGLRGVLPGVGSFDPLDWGLGFELRDGKDPHWTGTRNSPATYGHFGGAGTFLWVDPDLDRALVCLTDRDFGPWALEAWPPWSGTVIATIEGRQRVV